MDPTPGTKPPGISKVKLAVGAASLFLFIVGLKRSFRMDDAPDGARIADDEEDEGMDDPLPAPARGERRR